MKKRALFIVGALMLCACIAVGATLAYLADTSDTVTNTFTFDASTQLLEVDVEELSWDPTKAVEYLPGATIAKDPAAKLTKGKDAWVALVITADNAKDIKTIPAILEITQFQGLKVGTTGATYIVKKDNDGNLYCFYNTKMNSVASSQPLFTGVKILNKYIGGANNGKPIPQDKYGSFDLLVTAYAVQATNPEIDASKQATDWSCEKAMAAAFPDTFSKSLSAMTFA